MTVDLRLYALIDPNRANGRDLASLTRLVAEGGATLVQLRDKTGSTRAIDRGSARDGRALAGTDIPLLINDRVDVALAAEADGVHIGWDDISAADARLLLGRTAIIGLSIKTLQQAQDAPLRASRLCVHRRRLRDDRRRTIPIRRSAPRACARIAAAIRKRAPLMPVGAIAGIDESNAAATIAAGADGVAIISALSMADDPKAAAREHAAVIDTALAKRGAA